MIYLSNIIKIVGCPSIIDDPRPFRTQGTFRALQRGAGCPLHPGIQASQGFLQLPDGWSLGSLEFSAVKKMQKRYSMNLFIPSQCWIPPLETLVSEWICLISSFLRAPYCWCVLLGDGIEWYSMNCHGREILYIRHSSTVWNASPKLGILRTESGFDPKVVNMSQSNLEFRSPKQGFQQIWAHQTKGSTYTNHPAPRHRSHLSMERQLSTSATMPAGGLKGGWSHPHPRREAVSLLGK